MGEKGSRHEDICSRPPRGSVAELGAEPRFSDSPSAPWWLPRRMPQTAHEQTAGPGERHSPSNTTFHCRASGLNTPGPSPIDLPTPHASPPTCTSSRISISEQTHRTQTHLGIFIPFEITSQRWTACSWFLDYWQPLAPFAGKEST